KLPLAYGEFASVSPDAKQIVFTEKSRIFRTWKRYRGGMNADIWTFDLTTLESKNLTDSDTNDELPMWHGNRIYYLSDAGNDYRYNIWMYDLSTGKNEQITHFQDFDVHWPAIGPEENVFEAGEEDQKCVV